jgi:aldehyde:ferredoxin oxidoreductase
VIPGYIGKILFVDLSTGEIYTDEPDEKLYREFIGGQGVGARIIFSRQREIEDVISSSTMTDPVRLISLYLP